MRSDHQANDEHVGRGAVRKRFHVLDPLARRSNDGLHIVGGVPPRLLSLTPRGRSVLDAALTGDRVEGSAGRRLVRHLLDVGLIHPAGAPGPDRRASLTSIVPVRSGAPSLESVVASLRTAGDVLVVDDGSTDGSPEAARRAGARVLENAGAAGPAGARNTGLAASSSELVAFVDADCVSTAGWLNHLVGLFDDPALALAAPRVRSVPGSSQLARYERSCSPLDLGPYPSVVAPGRRLTFVPSAAIVARRTALLHVGGFDEELEVGEDVDLVWRLVAAGWTVRYAPESEVLHHPRETLYAMARQRFHYGGSAPVLERRHSGAATPMRAGYATVAIWLAAALRGPVVGGACLAASTLIPALKVRGQPSCRSLIASAVARGHLRTTRHLMRVLVREWLPMTALACMVSARARRVAIVAVAVDTLASRDGKESNPSFPSHLALRAVDNVAYAAGLWRAALGGRSVRAIRFRLARPGSVVSARSTRLRDRT